jgi:transposase-like protein
MESKYPYAIRSWEENQEELTVFLTFKWNWKIIYTTNLIENLNGKSESTPKTNYHFNGWCVLKVCLNLREATRKWSMPIKIGHH